MKKSITWKEKVLSPYHRDKTIFLSNMTARSYLVSIRWCFRPCSSTSSLSLKNSAFSFPTLLFSMCSLFAVLNIFNDFDNNASYFKSPSKITFVMTPWLIFCPQVCPSFIFAETFQCISFRFDVCNHNVILSWAAILPKKYEIPPCAVKRKSLSKSVAQINVQQYFERQKFINKNCSNYVNSG